MFIRNPYLRLVIYIIMLIAFAVCMVYLIITSSWYAILPASGVVWSGQQIITLFRRLHEKISYFFNAVENEDSTLYFPENIRHRPSRELNQSLNRMNRLIQEVKLRDRRQEQFYSVLLEQVTTGIVVTDEKGSILQANSSARRLFDYQSLRHVEQLRRVDSTLYQAVSLVRKGSPHQFVKVRQGNTMRQLSLNGTSLQNNGKELRIISVHDISNELDVKELESWQKLIRVLTHEIMNSITPITSLSETLLSYYSQRSEGVDEKSIENIVRGLNVISERGTGLIRFVESYRSLTSLPRPVITTVSLTTLIRNILLLLEREAGYHRITFNLHTDRPDIDIEGDEAQLSQVLINLIKNAMQAVEGVTAPVVTISARSFSEGHCEVTITDNGHGIAPEIVDQIFIPFFTTRESGSGIGLSLSRQIMKNHGGHIEVRSTPGNTTFTLLL